MKLIFSLSLFLLQAGVSLAQSNPLGCVTDVDPNVDYFFDKVTATVSETWTIEYFNTYKIVNNLNPLIGNETYLLYQCGTEIPQDVVASGNFDAIVEIPVKSVGIGVVTLIPHMEQLGVVDSIIALTTNPIYVASPCLLENIEQGSVVVLQSREEYENYTATPEITEETLLRLESTLGFHDTFTVPTFNPSVRVTEYLETTNAGIFEYIKFFSAFFNLEAKANEIFDTTEMRWDCVSEASSLTATTDAAKPKVLWATYIAYCEGWDVAKCPNYYCEFAEQCSVDLILTNITGNFSDLCQANYLSIDDVLELGKDADYWFYTWNDWNDTYTLFKDELDTLSVVQNKQVYDYQASGPNAWFETRFGEYFVVLQDFCSVVGTVTTPFVANRTYFRNVMDGSPIGNVGTECTEGSRSNSILPVVGAVCDDLNLPAPPTVTPVTRPVPTMTPPTPVAAPTSASSTIYSVVGIAIAAIVALVL